MSTSEAVDRAGTEAIGWVAFITPPLASPRTNRFCIRSKGWDSSPCRPACEPLMEAQFNNHLVNRKTVLRKAQAAVKKRHTEEARERRRAA
jgi:hypothetical protein